MIIISVRLRLVGSVGGHPGRGRGGSGGGLAAPATANYSFSGEWTEWSEGKERNRGENLDSPAAAECID